MEQDPYSILGVAQDANEATIRKAYRALAKQHHPDLNPGDPSAADRFRAISAAYEILGDADKRRKFDAGEIDANGEAAPNTRFYRDYAEADGGNPYQSRAGFQDFADYSDIFNTVFGDGARRSDLPLRGADVRYHLPIAFRDAALGAETRVTLPDGRALDVTIPAGVRDGQVLRLRGQGEPGTGGARAGDALIEIAVRADPVFERDGDDVRCELPIGIDDAVLGAQVEAPTLTGRVSVTVPPGTSSGRTLRLKGKGIKRRDGSAGDQLIALKIVLPAAVDDTLRDALRDWRGRRSGADGRPGAQA